MFGAVGNPVVDIQFPHQPFAVQVIDVLAVGLPGVQVDITFAVPGQGGGEQAGAGRWRCVLQGSKCTERAFFHQATCLASRIQVGFPQHVAGRVRS